MRDSRFGLAANVIQLSSQTASEGGPRALGDIGTAEEVGKRLVEAENAKSRGRRDIQRSTPENAHPKDGVEYIDVTYEKNVLGVPRVVQTTLALDAKPNGSSTLYTLAVEEDKSRYDADEDAFRAIAVEHRALGVNSRALALSLAFSPPTRALGARCRPFVKRVSPRPRSVPAHRASSSRARRSNARHGEGVPAVRTGGGVGRRRHRSRRHRGRADVRSGVVERRCRRCGGGREGTTRGGGARARGGVGRQARAQRERQLIPPNDPDEHGVTKAAPRVTCVARSPTGESVLLRGSDGSRDCGRWRAMSAM